MFDLLSFALCLIGLLAVSLYWTFYGKARVLNSDGDNRYTGSVFVVVTLGAILGSGSVMGLPEQVVMVGWLGFLVYMSYLVDLLLSAQFVVPALVRLDNISSVGDLMAHYYGKWGRVLSGVAITFKCISTIAIQIMVLAAFVQYFLGMLPVYALILSTLALVGYAALGLDKNLTLIETAQFAVLAVALPMLLNLAIDLVGGYESLFFAVPHDCLALVPSTQKVFEYGAIALLMMIPVSNPIILQRLLNSRDEKQLKFALRLNAVFAAIIYVIVAVLALTALVINPEVSPRLAMPYLVDSVFPTGLKELLLVAIMGVVVTEGELLFRLGCVSIVRDVINPIRKTFLSRESEVRLNRAMILLFGLCALAISLNASTILQVIVASRFIWTPMLIFPLLAGLGGFHVSRRSFLVGALAGLLTMIIWLGWIEDWVGFNGYFVSFCVSGLVFSLNQFVENYRTRTFQFNIKCSVRKYLLEFLDRFIHFGRGLKNCCPTLKQIQSFCSNRIESKTDHYTSFGIFVAFMYVMPYANWSDYDVVMMPHTVVMRFIGGFLAFFLVLRNRWPEILKVYLPLYWYVTLFYTLSFLMAFMVFETNASWESLSNMLLGLFLLGILVDWVSFVVIILLGIASAVGVYALIDDISKLSFTTLHLQWMIYMYSFAVLISVIFSRQRENGTRNQIEAIKHQGAFIAHETLGPITSMAATAEGLDLYLPKLINVYETAKQAGLVVEEIPKANLKILRKLPEYMRNVSQCSLVTIDILLNQIKGDLEWGDPQHCPISHCIERALETYPFLSGERALISWNRKDDFEVWVRPEMLLHVFYNLIKNSLYQISKDGRGEIEIWIERSLRANELHFKDTASGVDEVHLPLLFTPGFTSKRKGNGLGLPFCKQTLESVGGSISCRSQKDEYAEFILTFPVLEMKK